jgi:hypothetical protein
MIHRLSRRLSWSWYPHLSTWRWWYLLTLEDAPWEVWVLDLGHLCLRWRRRQGSRAVPRQ